MKAIILAGGLGSRLGNLTENIPKPMLEIGGRPILWHIMKIYAHYGIRDFVICGGYKVNVIKDYFIHYDSNISDFTINLSDGSIEYYNCNQETDWKVTVADTGRDTLKGGRIKRIEKFIDDDINFMTYGDGIADIDINELLAFHKMQNTILTLTGVHPQSQFGEIEAEGNLVTEFKEKAQVSQGIINGGFMVFNREMFDYLTEDENCDFEFGPLAQMAEKGQVSVYRHKGNWACMDTEREMKYLEKLWQDNKAFWKVW
ncbi:MAG: glucose-1-phosphate cytidylyltransferase [Ruminococcus sp.]|nr:glucose-1-phosphate cytidylyltransferase [Ruminococcus sp.]